MMIYLEDVIYKHENVTKSRLARDKVAGIDAGYLNVFTDRERFHVTKV